MMKVLRIDIIYARYVVTSDTSYEKGVNADCLDKQLNGPFTCVHFALVFRVMLVIASYSVAFYLLVLPSVFDVFNASSVTCHLW